MEHLSEKQESFCETAGVFGVLITLTCLIQHLIFMVPTWITNTAIFMYLLSIVGFALLVKKSTKAFLILLISTILVFIMNDLIFLSQGFSPVVLILFLYSFVITVLIKTSQIQKQLKQKVAFEKEEKAKWKGII